MYFNLVTNGTGQAYTTSSEVSTFEGWTLASLDTIPYIYQFNLDIESSDIQIVDDLKLYNGYPKYPAWKFGNRKYKKGSLTTMPYSCQIANFDYTNDEALLNNIIAFINNKKMKTLTNMSGDVITVCTMNAKYKYMEGLIETPYHLTFEYIQVG